MRAARLSLIATLLCLAWPVAALAQDLVTQSGQGSAINIDLGMGDSLDKGAHGCSFGFAGSE